MVNLPKNLATLNKEQRLAFAQAEAPNYDVPVHDIVRLMDATIQFDETGKVFIFSLGLLKRGVSIETLWRNSAISQISLNNAVGNRQKAREYTKE